MRQFRFAPHGYLALPQKAWGGMFEMVSVMPKPELQDGVAQIAIRGPLEHHMSWCFDSYDGIRMRVKAALEQTPKAIVLCIDSPGGLVSGCFDTAREIRLMCDEAGIPLYAHIEGQACSAAYALACVADHISVSATAGVGSIGVIDTLLDVTAQDRANGVMIRFVTSGARKTDGNPHAEMTDGAVAASQSRVNVLAGLFFDLVAQMRGISTEQIQKLEASILIGAEAVGAGLVDAIDTYDSLLAKVASGALQQETNMGTKAASKDYEEAIATLRKIAQSDDEEAAKKAKRMLAAELAEEEPPAPEKKEEPVSAAPDEKKDEEAKAIALKALAAAHSLEAKDQKREEEIERSTLLASRPDFAPELVKILKTSPMATVREMVKDLPVVQKPKADPAAVAKAETGTRGSDQGSGLLPPVPTADTLQMDRAMGLAPKGNPIRKDPSGRTMVFGAFETQEQARAVAAQHGVPVPETQKQS